MEEAQLSLKLLGENVSSASVDSAQARGLNGVHLPAA